MHNSAIQLMVNGFYTYQLFFTALFYLPIQLFLYFLLEVIVFIITKKTKKTQKNAKTQKFILIIIMKCIFTCKLLIFII